MQRRRITNSEESVHKFMVEPRRHFLSTIERERVLLSIHRGFVVPRYFVVAILPLQVLVVVVVVVDVYVTNIQQKVFHVKIPRAYAKLHSTVVKSICL